MLRERECTNAALKASKTLIAWGGGIASGNQLKHPSHSIACPHLLGALSHEEVAEVSVFRVSAGEGQIVTVSFALHTHRGRGGGATGHTGCACIHTYIHMCCTCTQESKAIRVHPPPTPVHTIHPYGVVTTPSSHTWLQQVAVVLVATPIRSGCM